MNENKEFLNQQNGEPPVEEKKVRKPRKQNIVVESVNTETPILQENDFITKELTKFNLSDSVIAKWKEDFLKLSVQGLSDKEGYQAVDEARKLIKRTRIEVEHKGKDMRRDALDFQKAVIKEEKRLVEALDPIETHLENEINKIEDEKKKIREERERQEQIRTSDRINKLTKFGLAFNGEQYSIADLVITAVQIKLYDEFMFTNFLQKCEVEFEKEKVRLAEIERIKKEESEKLAAEQAKLKAEREVFEAEKKLAEEREAKLKVEAEIALKKQAEERSKLEAERIAIMEAKVKQRASALYQLGMSFNGDSYIFQDIVVTSQQVVGLSTSDFEVIVTRISPEIAAKKELLEKQRIEEIEEAKKEAIALDELNRRKLERTRLDAEYAAKIEAEKQAALRPDREKFLILAKGISLTQLPEMSTEGGKIKLVEVKAQFKKFEEYLIKAAENLK